EVGGDIGFPFERSQIPALAFASGANFALLLLLGAIGLPAIAARAGPLLIPVGAFFAAAMATCLLFYVQTRYRLTAWPLLIPFASIGLERGLGALRADAGEPVRTRVLAALALLLCLVSIASAVRQDLTASDRVSGWLNWGGALERSGDADAALHAYERILSIEPNSRYALENLSRFHLDRDELEAARRRLFALVAAHPDSAVGHNNLAVLYMREGNWEAARRSALRSVQLRPTEVSGYANLAKANLALGRLEEACQAYAPIAPQLAGDPRAQPLREACGGAAPD
ncbi:MAG: tetratricopeptide repeat protein, partial [Deltaproteobacteria bacterium]